MPVKRFRPVPRRKSHISTQGWVPSIKRPEHELLLCCARTNPDPEVGQRIRELIETGIDWRYLVKLAHEHRLWPLLYKNLRVWAPDDVPADVLQRLRLTSSGTTSINLMMTGELIRILALFEEEGIHAIVLKGPVLGITLYGGIGHRPFGDLDILVSREDLQTCKRLLMEHGYAPGMQMSTAEEIKFIDDQFAYHLVAERNGLRIDVELHWALTHRFFSFNLDPDALRNRTTKAILGGKSIPMLGHEDSFLFLCAHGTKHEWCQLILLVDVAEKLRKHELNWRVVFEQARDSGSVRMFNLALLLAHELLAAPLPDFVLQSARADHEVCVLAAWVLENLFREGGKQPGLLEMAYFHEHVRERVQDRIPYYFHKMRLIFKPNEKDYDFVNLPERLGFLYYIVRPIRALYTAQRDR